MVQTIRAQYLDGSGPMSVKHSTYETVAAHPALETLGQGVPVLVTQRHSLVLNKFALISYIF